jgi:DNA-binding NarL/FixJ family response regulator
METVRIVIADDHEIVRAGLRALLETQPGWTVVAEAHDGKQAVEKVLETKPHVAILDIQMPGLNGLDATREILKAEVKARVLILTMHESDGWIRVVLDAGARGYVLKSDAAHDLIAAVEAVRHGKIFFTSRIAEVVLGGFLMRGKGPSEIDLRENRLTPRQRDILKLLAGGKANVEIASTFGISVKTVETHRANILRRLSCHSISDLVRYALRNKIIEP